MAINSLSSASKGLSGLASGMDTQSMVDAMLSGTQAKIDKQKQQKTVLGYKQTMYRDIWTSLKGLQDNYMSYGSKNSMLYSSFYNKMNAVSKASSFKVTGSDGALVGKTQVNAIHQLAKAATVKTAAGKKVSGAVEGTLDIRKIADKQELRITLDGITKTISMPQATAGGAALDEEAFATQLQESITRAFGNGITVNYNDVSGQLSFAASDPSREFIIRGSDDAMSVLGMPNGASNKINIGIEIGDLNFATPLMGERFEFSINDEKFSFTAENTVNDVITAVNRSSAGVQLRYSALDDKFILESTVSGAGANIKIEQTEGNLMTAMFGAVKGGGGVSSSQSISYGDLTGRIGGFPSFTEGETITADAKASFEKALENYEKQLNEITKNDDFTMKFTVDGTEVEVTLGKRAEGAPNYKIDDLVNKINTDPALSAKGVKIELQKGKDADGNDVLTGGVTLKANTGVKVELDIEARGALGLGANNGKVATGSDTLASLGGTGTHNVVFAWGMGSDGKPLTSLVVLDGTTTMTDAAQKIQDKLQQITGSTDAKVVFDTDESGKGRFRIFGVDIPMTIGASGIGNKDPLLFGQALLELNAPASGTLDGTTGQNAILDINGIRVERNSNEFTVDGLSYELTEVFNSTAKSDGTFEITDNKATQDIIVTRDTDQIVDGIKKFMEDYNKILDKAWGMLKADATYREYAPLTDKQKEAMSDREVELWEKKSQEGLLRGDDTVDGIMDAMRRALLNRPNGSKYSMAELGISSSYDIEKGYGGKLVMDADGEAKLREILTQEPEEVERLFAGSNGLMTELNKVLRGATSVSSMDKDDQIEYAHLSLANLAGRPGFPDNSSTIYNQMQEINKNLENLNVKYKSEYTRYWKQYSQMEQLISNMNQQSSWLTQQFQ